MERSIGVEFIGETISISSDCVGCLPFSFSTVSLDAEARPPIVKTHAACDFSPQRANLRAA